MRALLFAGLGLLAATSAAAQTTPAPTPAEAPADPPTHAHAHGAHAARAGDHAPIGVMGDHMHAAGEFMLSYRFMRMQMDGNRDDSRRVSDAAVLRDYPVTPTGMDMEMHMVGAMWAPWDAVTFAVMVPFLRLDMDHETRTGASFGTRTRGIGDVTAGALVRLFDVEGWGATHHAHLNLGLGFPTGSITERDDTPAGHVRLPYPMQLGTGTWDLLPGVTYTGARERWSWGAQLRARYGTGTNDEGYRWGHRWGATAWGQRSWIDWLSTSLRLDYQDWHDIRGMDDALNPALVPTADPNLRAGRRLDVLLGVNLLVTGGPLRGNRFALEVGAPIAQDLDGPQLETDWTLTAGWQLAF